MSTMIWPLRRAAGVAPDSPAVMCAGLELTYAEMWDRCRRLAGALRALGVEEGDRVAVVAANCHRYLEIYQAVPGAGMVLVPLNQRHTSAELRYALDDSGAKVLFAGREVDDVPAGVRHVLDLRAGYEELIAGAAPADFPDVPEDTLAGLFYTGGTTGTAKGVMLSHRNLVANALHYQACCAFGPETCWLVAAPLFHLAGSMAVLPTVWSAGRQAILAGFAPGPALDLIEAHGATATVLVPTMLAALTEEQRARPRDVSSLRVICHGGAPCATETLRRAHATFPSAELVHIYGATETSPIATSLRFEERLLDAPQARSCGQPAVGVELAVVSADGATLPAGQVGEIAVRGANVMGGYWNKPDATIAALIDGWYHTGDLGYMDERRYVYLVDRAKDMIVSGGENVYSIEVEEVLYGHPAVLEAAVFGVPDPRWGEAVHAVVVPREPVGEQDLLRHCAAAVARYKLPKRIELRTEPLPKSGAGKVLKRELRAPYWRDQATMVSGA